MLKIQGQVDRYCDGVPRRHFLQIGGLALGGLSMPSILRAEAQAKAEGREVKTGGLGHKAVIMIYLSGGPSHQDMYDCLLYTSPSPRDGLLARMPSSA